MQDTAAHTLSTLRCAWTLLHPERAKWERTYLGRWRIRLNCSLPKRITDELYNIADAIITGRATDKQLTYVKSLTEMMGRACSIAWKRDEGSVPKAEGRSKIKATVIAVISDSYHQDRLVLQVGDHYNSYILLGNATARLKGRLKVKDTIHFSARLTDHADYNAWFLDPREMRLADETPEELLAAKRKVRKRNKAQEEKKHKEWERQQEQERLRKEQASKREADLKKDRQKREEGYQRAQRERRQGLAYVQSFNGPDNEGFRRETDSI